MQSVSAHCNCTTQLSRPPLVGDSCVRCEGGEETTPVHREYQNCRWREGQTWHTQAPRFTSSSPAELQNIVWDQNIVSSWHVSCHSLTDSLCLPCSALVPLAEEPRDVLQPPPNALLTRTGLILPQTPSTSMGLSLKIKPFDTDESQFLSLSMEEVPTAAPPSPPPRTTRSRTWWVRGSSRWQQSPVLVCVLAPE